MEAWVGMIDLRKQSPKIEFVENLEEKSFTSEWILHLLTDACRLLPPSMPMAVLSKMACFLGWPSFLLAAQCMLVLSVAWSGADTQQVVPRNVFTSHRHSPFALQKQDQHWEKLVPWRAGDSGGVSTCQVGKCEGSLGEKGSDPWLHSWPLTPRASSQKEGGLLDRGKSAGPRQRG